MPNRNRQRGDYFERRTRDALEHDGWVVVRSAGSLGAADLVAMKQGAPVSLVSCKKTGYLRPAEASALLHIALKAGALPVLASHIRPGWVALDVLNPMGARRVGELHFPPHQPRPRKAREPEPEDPAQLTIYDAFPTD